MIKNEINNSKSTHQGQNANVLIVGNDTKPARFILEILARKGIRGIIANDEKTAVDLTDKNNYNLVFAIAQIDQPIDSSKLLRKVQANSPELPVIMIGKAVDAENKNEKQIIRTAVTAIRAGYYDFLIEPLDREKIENLLDALLPNHSVRCCDCAEQGTQTLYRVVGGSAKLSQTVDLAKKIAPTSASVLISGESGTGKELISYLVHHKSKRAQNSYIKVNCAALSDSLLESELFGHEKGAFTGAYTQRKGRFEMAHGGTLLLDEISETPSRFQAKLLRILEQQDFERVGGNDNIKVSIRIISTTNKDLLQEVNEGRFRQDLYYRLSGVRIIIPPLRERKEDLPDLIWHFVNLYARETQRHITQLDPVMMDIFTKYHWPGNIRQLRNVVLTSMILGVGQSLSLADISWLFDELQPLPQKNQNQCNPTDNDSKLNKPRSANQKNTLYDLAGISLEQIERQAILDTLRQTAGNQTKAAKVLGISDRTLRGKIRRYRQEGCLQLT
ncbi:MAG: sigma-54-dependent transcriptional regulator [Planctomycetota bacterium]